MPAVLLSLRESGALGAGRPQLASVCRRHRERTACMDRRRFVSVVVIFESTPTDDENSEQTVQRPVYVSDAHELWMGTFTPEEQTSRALRRATHLELDINRATEGLEGLS